MQQIYGKHFWGWHSYEKREFFAERRSAGNECCSKIQKWRTFMNNTKKNRNPEESLLESQGEKQKADLLVTDLEIQSRELLETAKQTRKQLEEYYVRIVEEEHTEALQKEVKNRYKSYKRASANMVKAYCYTADMNDELDARWNDVQKSRKKKIIPGPPANGVIDLEEQRANHFAQGINLYKILLICFVGSFAGVVVELLWCLLKNGYLESRSGLVYGPFNLLYGAGAVALTLALYRYRNKGNWISFLGGMLVGSVLEYVCSFGQEMLLGSRSWDYSSMPFNINGRICLLYSVFWGFLGVLWVKNIYPRMAKVILKIPNKAGKIITWILTAFFIFNIVVTCLAVGRWSQRIDGSEPSNAFFAFIDERFPDERMERIFANMEFNQK